MFVKSECFVQMTVEEVDNQVNYRHSDQFVLMHTPILRHFSGLFSPNRAWICLSQLGRARKVLLLICASPRPVNCSPRSVNSSTNRDKKDSCPMQAIEKRKSVWLSFQWIEIRHLSHWASISLSTGERARLPLLHVTERCSRVLNQIYSVR